MSYHEKLKSRVIALFFCILLLFLALFVHLFLIQVREGESLRYRALLQRTEKVSLSFPRGNFYDRQGLPLTGAGIEKKVAIIPSLVTDKKKLIGLLVSFLSVNNLEKRLQTEKKPFFLDAKINPEQEKELEKLQIPGVLVLEEKQRYRDRPLAAHLIGYINQADNQGICGLERVLDEKIKNTQTENVILTRDGRKEVIAGLGIRKQLPPTSLAATKIILTIDQNWQKAVETVLDKTVKKGAVVVLNPSNGEVLAMASRPNFNPNRVANYLTEKNAILLNRALIAYPPGSIFKIITASAALEEGLTKVEEQFTCPGYFQLHDHKIACHKKEGHGTLSLREGFAMSCNPVFIELGLRLGEERLLQYGLRFGLGQYSGIGLLEERKGNMPNGQRLYAGDLANLSIGQGSLEVTPLQAAVMLGVVVNDGKKIAPVLMRGDKERAEQVISVRTARKLQRMLEEGTKIGTGRSAYVASIGTAGKTGSAEVGTGEAHAWFVGYGPTKVKPEWVMAVFVEEGESGSTAAAPVFRQITEKYLADRHKASSLFIE